MKRRPRPRARGPRLHAAEPEMIEVWRSARRAATRAEARRAATRRPATASGRRRRAATSPAAAAADNWRPGPRRAASGRAARGRAGSAGKPRGTRPSPSRAQGASARAPGRSRQPVRRTRSPEEGNGEEPPRMSEPEAQRIDKWLWHARFARTRGAAQELARSGHVRVNRDKVREASRLVRPGDVLTLGLAARRSGHPNCRHRRAPRQFRGGAAASTRSEFRAKAAPDAGRENDILMAAARRGVVDLAGFGQSRYAAAVEPIRSVE